MFSRDHIVFRTVTSAAITDKACDDNRKGNDDYKQ